MSELKQAIAYLEDGIKETDNILAECSPALQAELLVQRGHYEVAIRAMLRAQPDNAPLTLDELRGMDGEPVWIIWPDGRIKNEWCIVGSALWHMMDFFDPYLPCDYGKTWLAYRRKREDA